MWSMTVLQPPRERCPDLPPAPALPATAKPKRDEVRERGVPGIMVAILGLRRSSGALDAAKLKVVFRIPGRRRRYLRMLSVSLHPRPLTVGL